MGLNEKFFKSASANVPVGNENFDTVLYEGNNGTKIISSLNFAPDLIWLKNRETAVSHCLFDTIRGAGTANQLYSDDTKAQGADTNLTNLVSFNSNGFTLGATSGFNVSNRSNDDYVAWCWRASASNATNIDGDIESTVRANVETGFSIVKWQTSTNPNTVGHGLDSAPELIIGKGINWASSWPVYSLPVGNDKKMSLNDSIGAHTSSIWGNLTPTDTTFKQDFTGTANRTTIAYCFHSVPGYQKIGSYNGNAASGSGTTQTITTGFLPRFVLIKNTSSGSQQWVIVDSVRGKTKELYPDLSNAENTDSGGVQSFNATNFIVGNGFNFNRTSNNYIFLAIA